MTVGAEPKTYRPLVDIIAEYLTASGVTVPAGLTLGWRVCHRDLRSRSPYRWPWPGNWAHPEPTTEMTIGNACPQHVGDGLCIAITPHGASSGGISMGTGVILAVAYRPADVLGQDDTKIRVRAALVLDVIGARSLDLTYADLTHANLRGADLTYADLTYADLSRAVGVPSTVGAE